MTNNDDCSRSSDEEGGAELSVNTPLVLFDRSSQMQEISLFDAGVRN